MKNLRGILFMTIQIDEIGFDFDGVIADTAETFIKLVCREYGHCSFTKDDITNFDLENCLDLPLAHVEKIFTDILTDSIGTGLQPMDGAIEALTRFSQISTVTIITARPIQQPVFDWLDRFFPAATCKKMRVIATGDHNDKVRYIHKYNLKYFVDDRAETCLQLGRENIIPIVFSQPWNKNRHTLQTVANWLEIEKLIL